MPEPPQGPDRARQVHELPPEAGTEPAEEAAASRPTTLPAGRHHLDETAVHEHQRGRLIDAISALCSERGYADVVIADIVARAAVSKSTFYRFYEAKSDCLFDAHKHHSARLLAAIDSAPRDGDSRQAVLRAAIRIALSFCSQSPDAAKLLTTGILSAGPEGADRYQTTVTAIAGRLCPSGGAPDQRSADALAAALFAAPMVMRAVDSADSLAVLSLESAFVEIVLFVTDRT